jgi:prepilin-type N-terminal cleavage/methylation domain-containing protein
MKYSDSQAGFSAVELLITLLIGSLFIIMGYQLYSVSITNGAEARQEAIASDTAYSELQRLKTTGTSVATCPGTPTVTTVNVLSNTAVMTTTISCPYPTDHPKIRLAQVKVKYNKNEVEATHAMYITEN